MKLLGILNLSEDSFSDGGLYSQTNDAIAQAVRLHEAGAWAVDVGAVSSNPESVGLSPAQEIARLEPVLEALQARGIRVSVDTFEPAVQRWAAERVGILNDIRGFPDPSVWPVLASAQCQLIVMHQLQDGRADRRESDAEEVLDRVFRFFEARLEGLVGAGIAKERLILDPGMGFFLGSTPEPSVRVLQALTELKRRFGCPVLAGISRKSFLGALLGGRAPSERGPATLAAELWAAAHGADWIRTHDVAALADGLRIQAALKGSPDPLRG